MGLFLYLFQERFIFRSSVLDKNFQYLFETDFDELNLEMEDGAILNALHFKLEEAKGLILYFHGNAGDLSRWGKVAIPFTQYGYEILIVDYRGYGKSTGKRSKSAMLSDAESVYAQATTLWEQDKIIVYGRSLGASFATHVSSEFSPSQLILESPFYSVSDLAKNYAWIYPLNSMLRFNFQNDKAIKDVSCPVSIFHGNEDLIVPIESGRKLSEQGDNVQFIEIPGRGHNDLGNFKSYWDEIESLLE